jgi:hypothetical protein
VDRSIGVKVVELACCFRSECAVEVCYSWFLGFLAGIVLKWRGDKFDWG